MKIPTQEWIKKAENDWRVALNEWGLHDPVYDAICFHAQQCAEKYLKAWLIEQGIDFPKSHDLFAIANLCLPSLADVQKHLEALSDLSQSAVETRYPGNDPNLQEVETSINTARTIRELIRKKLLLPD